MPNEFPALTRRQLLASLASSISAAPVRAAAPAGMQSWPLNTPSRTGIHDVAPAPDGGVWFTAQRSGHLGWFDPASGRVELVALGPNSAPHGVIPGPDQAAWITDGGQNAIVRVDWPGRASLKGCPLNSASEEYNHQPGPMRDAVMERQRLLERELAKAAKMAVDAGELAPDTDTAQVAFEMVGIVLSYYRCELLMGHDVARQRALTAYSRLIDSARPLAASPAAARR